MIIRNWTGSDIRINKNILPMGAKQGDWLQVDVKNDKVFSATADLKGTADAKKRIQDKLARLRGRNN